MTQNQRNGERAARARPRKLEAVDEKCKCREKSWKIQRKRSTYPIRFYPRGTRVALETRIRSFILFTWGWGFAFLVPSPSKHIFYTGVKTCVYPEQVNRPERRFYNYHIKINVNIPWAMIWKKWKWKGNITVRVRVCSWFPDLLNINN